MFGPIYFSLAEMASMAPIAGAQYHWGKLHLQHGSRRLALTSLQFPSLPQPSTSGFLVTLLGTCKNEQYDNKAMHGTDAKILSDGPQRLPGKRAMLRAFSSLAA